MRVVVVTRASLVLGQYGTLVGMENHTRRPVPVTTGIDLLRVRVRIQAVIPRGTPVIQPNTIAPCTPTFIVRHDLGLGYGVTPLPHSALLPLLLA